MSEIRLGNVWICLLMRRVPCPFSLGSKEARMKTRFAWQCRDLLIQVPSALSFPHENAIRLDMFQIRCLRQKKMRLLQIVQNRGGTQAPRNQLENTWTNS